MAKFSTLCFKSLILARTHSSSSTLALNSLSSGPQFAFTSFVSSMAKTNKRLSCTLHSFSWEWRWNQQISPNIYVLFTELDDTVLRNKHNKNLDFNMDASSNSNDDFASLQRMPVLMACICVRQRVCMHFSTVLVAYIYVRQSVCMHTSMVLMACMCVRQCEHMHSSTVLMACIYARQCICMHTSTVLMAWMYARQCVC